MKELLVPVFEGGKCVYTSPSVMDIRAYCAQDIDTLWDESRRLVNPHRVYIDLSKRLWNLKQTLLDDYSDKKF